MNKPETGDFLETDLITLHHRDFSSNPQSQMFCKQLSWTVDKLQVLANFGHIFR